MEIKVLEFDKRDITEDEVLVNMEFYINKANDGMELLSNDKKKALEILRNLRKLLREEYNYYNKAIVQKYIDENKVYDNYNLAVRDALLKQSSKAANYENLSSDLYDISDYFSYYKMIAFAEK